MLSILQVVLVELCRDRVGLMLNPDGPQGVQLWNSRQLNVVGLPTKEGWPSEKEILSGMSSAQCGKRTLPVLHV